MQVARFWLTKADLGEVTGNGKWGDFRCQKVGTKFSCNVFAVGV